MALCSSIVGAMKSRKRGEPTSSAGFGGIRPAGSTHNPDTVDFRTDSLAFAFPTSRTTGSDIAMTIASDLGFGNLGNRGTVSCSSA